MSDIEKIADDLQILKDFKVVSDVTNCTYMSCNNINACPWEIHICSNDLLEVIINCIRHFEEKHTNV